MYYTITGQHEVNITDLIQEKLGNSFYTTILAQYAGIPERLLQWYVNGRPVGPSNTIFHVKNDGLNSYLRFKQDDNQTYGTFMLKVNGTKWKDTLKLPHPQQISNLFESSKHNILKLVTKIVNGNILSDVKATPNSQSDTSDQFKSLTKQNPTNRKYLPGIIRLGQDKKQKIKQNSHYVRQDSIFSSRTNLAPDKKDSDRKFLKEVIRLRQNRKEESTVNEWTRLPAHAKSLEKNIHKKFVQGSNILQTLQSDFSELKQKVISTKLFLNLFVAN